MAEHLALVGGDQAGEDAQQRRLAAAGRPEHRDDLARLDRQADVAQDDQLAPVGGERLRDAAQLGQHLGGGRRVAPSGVTPVLVVPIGGVRYGRLMLKWKIGDVTVTKIVELEVAGKATWILPDLTAENLATVSWCRPHFATDDGKVVMSVHALVVESQGRRIMVDTCVGNDKTLNVPNWNKRQGPFLTDLAAAGFAADSIDTVLCTHLHVDHVGWNTRLENGRWVPTFGNARYLWHRAEYEYWSRTDQAIYGPVVQESVQPVFDAGLVDLVEPTHAVTSEVTLEPTHGHTRVTSASTSPRAARRR